jgi:hypothetical protein
VHTRLRPGAHSTVDFKYFNLIYYYIIKQTSYLCGYASPVCEIKGANPEHTITVPKKGYEKIPD